ncbi:hypothetical protein LguiA_021871 [Lonicera macranthoides]
MANQQSSQQINSGLTWYHLAVHWSCSMQGGLNSSHVNSMMNTPFYRLFNMYNQGFVATTKHRKSDLDIVRIIRCYNAPTGTFVFGGKHVKLTPTWVTKIFGVPCLGDRIDISGNQQVDTGIQSNFSLSRGQLQKTHVEREIVSKLKLVNTTDVDRVAQLMCVLLCNSVFFLNTGTSIPWFLAKLMSSIDEMNKYNWALAIYEWLMESIIAKASRPSTVTGCVPLLMVTSLIEADEPEDEDKPLFVIQKYVIDIETIGSRSHASEIDIEIRRRSRAPRTMTSMPVVSNTDKGKGKGKGIDIRGADFSTPKRKCVTD